MGNEKETPDMVQEQSKVSTLVRGKTLISVKDPISGEWSEELYNEQDEFLLRRAIENGRAKITGSSVESNNVTLPEQQVKEVTSIIVVYDDGSTNQIVNRSQIKTIERCL